METTSVCTLIARLILNPFILLRIAKCEMFHRLEALHSEFKHQSLSTVVAKQTDSLTRFKDEADDSGKKDLAPDMSFSSVLREDQKRPTIIFEVAYSESLKHAQEKARMYLLGSVDPCPSAVVIFNFKGKPKDTEYKTTTVEYEVLRIDPENTQDVKTYESGVRCGRHRNSRALTCK